jgi:GxxExxY protein
VRNEDEISHLVLEAAFAVHSQLGPGLLESVYESVLAYELTKREASVQRQVPIPIRYEQLCFEEGFRIDLLVEGRVIVELKSIEKLQPVHSKQLLTYLRLSDRRLGLILNFGEAHLKEGIKRIVNGLPE